MATCWRRRIPPIKDQIVPDVLAAARGALHRRTSSASRRTIEDAALDALIIIGDDQNEQFFDDNMPSILIYWGETIENNPLHMDEDAPQFWRKARSQYHEAGAARHIRSRRTRRWHLIQVADGRAVSTSASRSGSASEHGEGHAFGFVHRRLMPNKVVPIVPIALNTYFPPNQPRPRRCYDLGRAIAAAVRAAAGDGAHRDSRLRGLEPFHRRRGARPTPARRVRRTTARALCADPADEAQFRLSEIRNWITVAGAAAHLTTQWQEYIPCYRSAAGTGCGMGFAVWK